jgi:hypothetical protein
LTRTNFGTFTKNLTKTNLKKVHALRGLFILLNAIKIIALFTNYLSERVRKNLRARPLFCKTQIECKAVQGAKLEQERFYVLQKRIYHLKNGRGGAIIYS